MKIISILFLSILLTSCNLMSKNSEIKSANTSHVCNQVKLSFIQLNSVGNSYKNKPSTANMLLTFGKVKQNQTSIIGVEVDASQLISNKMIVEKLVISVPPPFSFSLASNARPQGVCRNQLPLKNNSKVCVWPIDFTPYYQGLVETVLTMSYNIGEERCEKEIGLSGEGIAG